MHFKEFAEQYVQASHLQLRGMGKLEDVICENRYWKKKRVSA